MGVVTVRSPSSSPSQATALPSPLPSLPPSFCTNLAILIGDRHSDAVKFKMLGGEGIGETFAFSPSAWDLKFKEGLILPPLATLFPFHFGFHVNFLCWGGMALSYTSPSSCFSFCFCLNDSHSHRRGGCSGSYLHLGWGGARPRAPILGTLQHPPAPLPNPLP